MKNPCALRMLRQVIPVVRLWQMKPASTESVPYGRARSRGSRVVSPAQTIRAEPVGPTPKPWPKSTTLEQEDGRGGGDQERVPMSHRAPSEYMMQPMFPVGDLKLARWTTGAGAGAVCVLWLLTDELVVVAVLVVAAVLVLAVGDVTVTVTVEPPQPPSAPMTRTAAVLSPRCLIRRSLSAPAAPIPIWQSALAEPCGRVGWSP